MLILVQKPKILILLIFWNLIWVV